MPATLFRAAILLAMALHVFFMDSLAREMGRSAGLTAGGVAARSAFALVMMLPLAWAVALPDLPEMVRRQRRQARGRCVSCGYPLQGRSSDACPECGAPRRQRELTVSASTLRRFATLAAAAWVLGVVAAETWAWLDERAFAGEAARWRGPGVYSRPRRWPMGGATLWYLPGEGVSATPPPS